MPRPENLVNSSLQELRRDRTMGRHTTSGDREPTLSIALHGYLGGDIVVDVVKTGPSPIARAAYQPKTGGSPVGIERVPSPKTGKSRPNLGHQDRD